jgi:hypothetical protein
VRSTGRRSCWWINKDESQRTAKNRALEDVEKELARKQELEARFERLKEREEELIRMFENSNNSEKQAMTELRTLLCGKNGDVDSNGANILNGSVLRKPKKN